MVKILAFIGGLVVVCIVIIILYAIVLFCEYFAQKYKIKHRFDKPPTAKCYCRDCKYWNCRSWNCRKYDSTMTASYFCCSAEPLNATELQKRDAEEAEYIKRLKKITNVNRTGGLHGTNI